jgi:hypothetical protein
MGSERRRLYSVPWRGGGHGLGTLILRTGLSETQSVSNNIVLQPAPASAGGEPNWEHLESLMLKRKHTWDQKKARHGIEEYRKFLKMRIKDDAIDSWRLGTLSQMVEAVWRTHLSFNDHYLQDVAVFAAEIGAQLTHPNPNLVLARRCSPCPKLQAQVSCNVDHEDQECRKKKFKRNSSILRSGGC